MNRRGPSARIAPVVDHREEDSSSGRVLPHAGQPQQAASAGPRNGPHAELRAERGGQVVLDIPHRHSTGASGLVIHTHRGRPGRRWPLALPGRGVKVPARSRGTPISKGPILTSPPSWTWFRFWRYHEPGRLARPCRNPGARSSQAARPLSKASLGAVPAADHQSRSCSPARHQLCSNKPSRAPAERSWPTTSRPPAEALLSSSVAVISVSPSTRAYTNH